MSARPWFKFYPSDWLGDAQLLECSMAAQGLWMRLLALMHQGDPYGYLGAGRTPSGPSLARLVNLPEDEAGRLVSELEEAGVVSRDDAGRLYSRRMVRDEAIRAKASRYGSLGGNPALMQRGKGGDKGKDNGVIPPHARGRALASGLWPESVESDSSEGVGSGEGEPDANGRVPKRKARSRSTKPTTAQAELVEWFQACWKHWRETEYAPQRKDFVAAAKLLKQASLEEVKERANRMLGSEDKFYQRAADLPLLYGNWNKLASEDV